MGVPSIVSKGVINFTAQGKPWIVAPSHPNYLKVKAALATGTEEELVALADIPMAVANFTSGKAEIKDGEVLYNGQPLHNSMTTRIMELMNEGFPFEPMLRFLENLMQNPSAQSIAELYDFLENRGLPITEDGHFLAYKAVQANFKDKHSGTIDNTPGQVVKIERREVDDRRENQCSFGLHVGAMAYVRSFGSGDDKVILVKVNPRDAVSVPKDHDAQKLRVCQYEVLSVYEGELPLSDKPELLRPLYGPGGEEYDPEDDEGVCPECGQMDDDCECDEPIYDPCDHCPPEADCDKCRIG